MAQRGRRDTRLVHGKTQSDDRRAHAKVIWVLTRVVQHRDVGGVDRVVETLDGLVLDEPGPKHFDRHLAGHFAGRVSAHPVGDDGQRVVDVHRVLIRLTYQSGVGRLGVTPMRQRTTSKSTPPTCTMSPRSRWTRPSTSSWFT